MRVALGLALLPWIAMSAALIPVATKTGAVATETIAIPNLTPAAAYSLLYSISPLQSLGPQAAIEIEIREGGAVLASKTLHAGDSDFYTQFRIPRPGTVAVAVRANAAGGHYSLIVNQWPASGTVKAGPIAQWQDAMTIPLGQTVFASGDDEEYIPVPGTPRKALADRSRRDWYKFEFTSPAPKLVFFQIDLMERDQIPVDVAIYRLAGGKLEEYFEGEDPVTMPHEVQALPGNKFTPRVLKERGAYYIAVHAGHPEYKLRTRVYDAPPYGEKPSGPRSITYSRPAIPGMPTRRAAAASSTACQASTRRPLCAWPATPRTTRCARRCMRCAMATRSSSGSRYSS